MNQSERLARIEAGLSYFAGEQKKTNNALEAVAEALKQIAVMEVKQAEDRNALGRAFAEIEDVKERIVDIEKELPIVRMASGWVFRAALFVMGTLGASSLAIIKGAL